MIRSKELQKMQINFFEKCEDLSFGMIVALVDKKATMLPIQIIDELSWRIDVEDQIDQNYVKSGVYTADSAWGRIITPGVLFEKGWLHIQTDSLMDCYVNFWVDEIILRIRASSYVDTDIKLNAGEADIRRFDHIIYCSIDKSIKEDKDVVICLKKGWDYDSHDEFNEYKKSVLRKFEYILYDKK